MHKYPVGGPRQPVYNLMHRLGFLMSDWSDKYWRDTNGIEVNIYGAGSMARITKYDRPMGEYPLDQLEERVAVLRFDRTALADH